MQIQEVLTAIDGDISIIIIVTLLACGYIIKHTPALNKVSNNLIPVILLALGLLITVFINPGNKDIGMRVIDAILNAAIAVAIHSSGKNIFEMVSNAAAKSLDGDSNDDEL